MNLMYTLVMTNTKSLRTTIKESIFQNDDNQSSFRFLIPPTFNGLKMTDFDIILKYRTADYEVKYLNVNYEQSYYEGMLSIVVPITRQFTYKQGSILLSLGFISKDELNEILFSTEHVSIKIERSEYSSSMSIVDRFIQKVNHLEQTVPDNIKTYPDSMEIQLESNGKPIGDRADIPCKGEVIIEGGGDSEWSEIDKSNGNSDLEWDEIS